MSTAFPFRRHRDDPAPAAGTDDAAPSGPGHTGEGRLPGDPPVADRLARMIRVDQAGEYGARRIYQGQLAVLGDRPDAAAIRHMAEQEDRHLDYFNREMVARRVRPTALSPLWHAAGFALGAATALLGPKAAMACTEAVETEIDRHYRRQLAELGQDEAALRDRIDKFRREELEHKDIAQAAGAAEAPGHPVLTATIRAASRTAIWLSERF
ncbi:MAG: demethoxyubiquinone hydroxylase family protein [Sneathiellaceae bacterium]